MHVNLTFKINFGVVQIPPEQVIINPLYRCEITSGKLRDLSIFHS